jgi:hypothetical protein
LHDQQLTAILPALSRQEREDALNAILFCDGEQSTTTNLVMKTNFKFLFTSLSVNGSSLCVWGNGVPTTERLGEIGTFYG